MASTEIPGYQPSAAERKLEEALVELEQEGQEDVILSENSPAEGKTHKALGEIRLSTVANIKASINLMRVNLNQAVKPNSQSETPPIFPPELED